MCSHSAPISYLSYFCTLSVFQNLSADSKKEADFFRLNPLLSNFDFCDTASIEKNKRLQLLTFRNRGEAEFKDWKLVPIREKEIPSEVFKVRTSIPI